MHVIFEEIGAVIPSVAVKDPKVTAFGPPALVIRLGDVHDYRNSIFVVVLGHPVEGIDGVTFDDSVALVYEFDGFHLGDVELFLVGEHGVKFMKLTIIFECLCSK